MSHRKTWYRLLFLVVPLALLSEPHVAEARHSDSDELASPSLRGVAPRFEALTTSTLVPAMSFGNTTVETVVPLHIPEELCGDYANLAEELPAHSVQLGCADGIWGDNSTCPEGDLCVTWCTLKGAVEVCMEDGANTYCEVVCFYGKCGGTIA